ncbi:MAG: hypothetical protein LBV41_06360 [Cytophagaceae bacterium]|nr:hypothetical protein [Cytophagaceae bacterium]
MMKRISMIFIMSRVICILPLIFLLCTSCVSLTPIAAEDWDEGTVLIVKSSQVVKIVENYGVENGFKYVAYRRLPNGTRSNQEWSERADGESYRAETSTHYTSDVMVVGINSPEDAPDRYNVIAVPDKPNKRITFVGGAAICVSLAVVLLTGAS